MDIASALPAPKYTGEEEQDVRPRGPRIISARDLDEQQVVLRRTGPPLYGHRVGWRPQTPKDFGDGGAFPEVPCAQYPADMGKKFSTTSNALAIQVDCEGKVDYGAIARQGHANNRTIHTSFKDLIPLRQRADAGEIDLARPSAESVEETRKRTAEALAQLVNSAVACQKPKNVKTQKDRQATYVRYTPNDRRDGTKAPERILKIQERQRDPMEPPKFKHKKIPRGPPSPPAPVMHSPPRKLTAQEQADWKIPPPVSNYKNPKGFTISLDKRLAAQGHGLQDVSINDKFAHLAEALSVAERHSRDEIRQRQIMQQRLADKEKAEKEENLRQLAHQVRAQRSSSRRALRSRSCSYSGSGSLHSDSDDSEHERREARKERQREEERKLRQTRMGTERRAQVMAREMNRDISEKIALGLAKPTQSGESMYDSRLFNRSSGFDSGINEDNPYDKPLFAAQEALSSIYRPRTNAEDDDEEAGSREMSRIQKSSRFGEALGKGTFKGTREAEAREGPVQFEKDNMDPFNVDKFLSEVGQKRANSLQGEDESSKRARVDHD